MPLPLAIGISALLFLLGFGFLYFASRSRRRATAAKAWPQAPGVIESSELLTHEDSDSADSYEARVTYRWHVAGRDYHGSAVTFGTNRTYSRSEAQAVVTRYPPGITVTVHHDPTDPSSAVLEPRAAGTGALTAVGLVFLVLGTVAAFVLIGVARG